IDNKPTVLVPKQAETAESQNA
ncbi:hypothetical protein ACNPLO_28065, partial [Klebsiella pneumoniae]